MTFTEQLQAAKGDLTARQVAAAVSPLLSVRTVEDWLADRRSPPPWTHEWIVECVVKGRNRQKLTPEERQRRAEHMRRVQAESRCRATATSGVGVQIAQMRAIKGMTLATLATKCGVSKSAISIIECTDDANPRTKTLAKIAEGLGVAVSTLARPRRAKGQNDPSAGTGFAR